MFCDWLNHRLEQLQLLLRSGFWVGIQNAPDHLYQKSYHKIKGLLTNNWENVFVL